MSGVIVMTWLLTHDSNLNAVVPVAKVYAGDIPLNTALPAISVMHISGVSRKTVAMSGTKLITDRVQVTVNAKTYASQKSILRLIEAACPLSRGTINGIACDSVLPDIEGPDLSMPDAEIYEQSLDFIVRFTR